VGRFLDTPVKRYSSGMYVRLAFAVAAHLEPEILVVDEVLAVGDAEFQRKCLGKMRDVARGGRTVLFVSHNMQAIRQLCTHGVLLRRGSLVQQGTVDEVVESYLREGSSDALGTWSLDEAPRHPLSVCGVEARLHGEQPEHSLEIEIHLRSTAPHKRAFVAIDITDSMGTTIMQALPTETAFIPVAEAQTCIVKIALPPLVPGLYSAGVWVGSHYTETLDCVPRCVSFEILRSPTTTRTVPHTPDHGYIVPQSRAELVGALVTQSEMLAEEGTLVS
jgi:lipopolysaccharide transport system ATP-binding protein